jgi:hypothetical protein
VNEAVRSHHRSPKICRFDEARANPAGLRVRGIDLFVPWGPEDSEVIEPDDPADALLGVSRPVGSVKLPCGPDLRALVCTVYEVEPGPEVRAIPFRMPVSGLTVWLQHELL